jgi:inosose dehydratase
VSGARTEATGVRFAINPLQWYATPDRWIDFTRKLDMPQLFADIRDAGFTAIVAAPSPDSDVESYAEELAAAGIEPAPGYFSGPIEDPAERGRLVAAAENLARQLAELGLTEMFVAAGMMPDAVRVERPAIGFASDEARLERMRETLVEIAEATKRHGVMSCLHQHVGSWIEVEHEVEWLLDRIEPELLALGPDTGHHAWAGTDPVPFFARHADRVKAIHIKDMRESVAESTRGVEGMGYREVVGKGLWTEPGRGELDLRGAIAALGESFSGWAIVEVDAPDLATPQESARASGDWCRSMM